MNAAALLFVAAGGAAGAVARYVTSTWVHGLLGRGFPWGTLVVNVVGSLLMGLAFVAVGELARDVDSVRQLRLLLMTGLLGGFTTFSAFSLETLLLLEQGAWLRALANVSVSLVACLAAAYAGTLLARQLHG